MSTGSVLITGCSDGGIGHAIALMFQQKGFHVFATARDTSKIGELKDLPNVTVLTLDVTQSSHIAAAVDAVRQKTGGSLTYLINNAGRNHFMPILDENLDVTRRLYETNVWGPLALAKALAPLVIEAKGTLVFVTSISGYVNVPYMGVYAASKRSLEIMAETLRLELAPFHTKVLSVVTGAVKTKGQTYFGGYELPQDSLYKPIEGVVASRAQGHDGVQRMDTAQYANMVVQEIVKGREGKYWCGTNAGGVYFGSSYLPQWMMDSGVVKGTGLDQLVK